MYQAIILGSVLLLTLYFLNRRHNPKLNMPPLVRYKYPIIGHTVMFYSSNSEEFLKQCRKEYGDIFRLYLWGHVRTYVGKEHTHEVFSKDDSFDFKKALETIFPLGAMLPYSANFTNSTKVIKDYMLSKLKFYTERMQKSLNLAIEKYIDHDEPKVIRDVYYMMARIISNPISNIFIGEEESQFEEVITAFSEFTTDTIKVFRIPPFIDFIYPGLHHFIVSTMIRLGLYNPIIKHKKVLIKHLKKQVYKRLQEKEKFGDSWKRPDDYLQDYIEGEGLDPNNINYAELSDKMCLFISVSVQTTSIACTNALVNLASRPEYMQELYEEQLQVHKDADENGILPFDALDNMKKLDSFIRESLRYSEHLASHMHEVLKDYTFSNGLQVPKGQIIFLYTDDIHRDESLQGPNPESFDPFRHINTNSSATKIGKNYMIFGSGRHACPGRYFAINEIKFFMHNIILKYNLRTESGKIEKPISFGPMKRPSKAGIIFERRK